MNWKRLLPKFDLIEWFILFMLCFVVTVMVAASYYESLKNKSCIEAGGVYSQGNCFDKSIIILTK